MKKQIYFQFGIFISLIFFLFSCNKELSDKGKARELFPSSNQSSAPLADSAYSDSELAELGKNVKKVEESVNKIIAKIIYKKQLYRRIADRCFELSLYHEAYRYYTKALDIDSNDETLHYKVAVICAVYHKENLTSQDEELTYANAEQHYKRAIKIRPKYQEALTGLATLYHFEMNKPIEALKLLHQFRPAERPTPQLLMTRAAICRFFFQHELINQSPFPGSSALLKLVNRDRGVDGFPSSDWKLLAQEDYQNVIDRFGTVDVVELQKIVETADRLQQSLNGSQPKD